LKQLASVNSEPTKPRPIGRLGRLSRDLAVYGFGEALVKVVYLISIPIYTRLFAPNEFGVLSYVTTVAGLLGAVLALGGDSAYARYYFEARTDEARRHVT
jgi:O-antigen/teichoic acid export membrane protein